MSIAIDDIRDLTLFKGLTDKELEVLSHHLERRTLNESHTIFRQDDAARSCFGILSGTVGVFITNGEAEEEIASIPAGSPLGHMALIDGKRRSATCKITSRSAVVVELTRDNFDRLFSAQTSFAYKILDNIVMDLVGRLRSTNDRLSEANRERTETALRRKTKDAAAMLMGKGGFDSFNVDELDPDSIEVHVPTLEQRMKDKMRR